MQFKETTGFGLGLSQTFGQGLGAHLILHGQLLKSRVVSWPLVGARETSRACFCSLAVALRYARKTRLF